MKNGSIKKLGVYALAGIMSVGIAIGSSLAFTGCMRRYPASWEEVDEGNKIVYQTEQSTGRFEEPETSQPDENWTVPGYDDNNNVETGSEDDENDIEIDENTTTEVTDEDTSIDEPEINEPVIKAPSTIDELFPGEDASEEEILLAKEYQSIVNETLNNYLKENMVNKVAPIDSRDLSYIKNVRWEIIGSGDSDEIDQIRMYFTSDMSETHAEYIVGSVTPKTELTLSDLYFADEDVLNEALDPTPTSQGAKFKRESILQYRKSEQTDRAALAQAIAEITGNYVPGQTTYIVERGYNVDTELKSPACLFYVLSVSEKGQTKITLSIADISSSATDEKFIENLKSGMYRIFEEESMEYGNKIIVDEEAQKNYTFSPTKTAYMVSTIDEYGIADEDYIEY